MQTVQQGISRCVQFPAPLQDPHGGASVHLRVVRHRLQDEGSAADSELNSAQPVESDVARSGQQNVRANARMCPFFGQLQTSNTVRAEF